MDKSHENELLVVLRRQVEKMRSVLVMLLVIPGTRVYGATFFSCTFFEDRDNSFDQDPSLSCWRSGWWFWYAFISFIGMVSLLVTALVRDKRLGSMEHHYPATRQYGFVLSMTKILCALIAISMGRHHATQTSAGIVGLLLLKLGYVAIRRPFAHMFLNRFTAFCVTFTIWCYAAAIYAVELGDSTSDQSVTVLNFGLLGIVLLYLVAELYNFTRVPNREDPAGGFGQHHVAWRFCEVYRVSKHGMHLDANGMTCEDHFDIRTGRRTSHGSGQPCAITDAYKAGDRPDRYHKAKANAEQMKADAAQRKANAANQRKPRAEREMTDTENPVHEGNDVKGNIRYVDHLQSKAGRTDRELRRMLGLLPTSELVQRARSLEQISEEDLHTAMDKLPDDNDLVDLVFLAECTEITRERIAMKKMGMGQLSSRAEQLGVGQDAIHGCFDESDPKEALIGLIVAKLEGNEDTGEA